MPTLAAEGRSFISNVGNFLGGRMTAGVGIDG